MAHRDRAGDPPGRREAAGGIGKASRRPRRFARATGGGFPRLSGGVARGSRCPAPPRHTLLAENLGKPSLWVIISAPWYNL
jgi:hypothetical protein